MTRLALDAKALTNLFRVTEGNNNHEKYIFWGVLGLWILGGIGKVTSLFSPDPAFWQLLTSAILLQGGRIWGRESERLRGKQ